LFGASTIVGLFAIHQTLNTRLDSDIDEAPNQEVEEFRLLADSVDPNTGEPFGSDMAAIFEVFVEQNVPADDEVFLGIIDGELFAGVPESTAAALASPDLLRIWSEVDEPRWGDSTSSEGDIRWLAVPLIDQSQPTTGRFVAIALVDEMRGDVDATLRCEPSPSWP
jgi:hypothetical protein